MKVGFVITIILGVNTMKFCSGFSSKRIEPPSLSPTNTGYESSSIYKLTTTPSFLSTFPLSSKTPFVSPPPITLTQQRRSSVPRPDAGRSLQALAIDTLARPQQGVSIADFLDDVNQSESSNSNSDFLPVLSTAFLITGNTVGAGSLVLPELAQGPGMGITTIIFLGCFVLNLVSGLALAEVAINQYEASGDDVPSSFKEFVQASLVPPTSAGDSGAMSIAAGVASVISIVSLFVNSCVLAFDFARFGEVGEALLQNVMNVDALTLGLGSAGVLALSMGTLSNTSLSNLTSIFVTALFISFIGMIIPGLSSVSQSTVMETFLSPGSDMSFHTIQHMAPIVLMSMIYQNIVPTVTKILDYDRTKTMTSIVLGSFLPLVMYVVWCFCSLGGGIDASTTTLGGPLISVFSIATLSGSAVGTGMSVAEECEAFLQQNQKDGNNEQREEAVVHGNNKNNVFSLPAVIGSVGIPLIGYLAFAGHDFTDALKIGGSLGSPLLYGVIPALLAWNQRKAIQGTSDQAMVPGGIVSLGTLGLVSTGYVGEELISAFI